MVSISTGNTTISTPLMRDHRMKTKPVGSPSHQVRGNGLQPENDHEENAHDTGAHPRRGQFLRQPDRKGDHIRSAQAGHALTENGQVKVGSKGKEDIPNAGPDKGPADSNAGPFDPL